MSPDQLWGSSYLICTWGSLVGVKQPACEIYHSPLSRAEVKSEWNYIFTPHMPQPFGMKLNAGCDAQEDGI
jgi:hypothetical protein